MRAAAAAAAAAGSFGVADDGRLSQRDVIAALLRGVMSREEGTKDGRTEASSISCGGLGTRARAPRDAKMTCCSRMMRHRQSQREWITRTNDP